MFWGMIPCQLSWEWYIIIGFFIPRCINWTSPGYAKAIADFLAKSWEKINRCNLMSLKTTSRTAQTISGIKLSFPVIIDVFFSCDPLFSGLVQDLCIFPIKHILRFHTWVWCVWCVYLKSKASYICTSIEVIEMWIVAWQLTVISYLSTMFGSLMPTQISGISFVEVLMLYKLRIGHCRVVFSCDQNLRTKPRLVVYRK